MRKDRHLDRHWNPKNACPHCGLLKNKKAQRCRPCALKLQKGEKAAHWKGGRSRHSQGYIMVRDPESPVKRYIPEHRLIWEQAYGKLELGIVVHHLNGLKDDNRLENLWALSNSSHMTIHGKRQSSSALMIKALRKRIRELESALQPPLI